MFNYQRATVASAAQIVASMGLDGFHELSPAMLNRRIEGQRSRTYAEIYDWLMPGELLDDPAGVVAVRLDRGIGRRVSVSPRAAAGQLSPEGPVAPSPPERPRGCDASVAATNPTSAPSKRSGGAADRRDHQQLRGVGQDQEAERRTDRQQQTRVAVHGPGLPIGWPPPSPGRSDTTCPTSVKSTAGPQTDAPTASHPPIQMARQRAGHRPGERPEDGRRPVAHPDVLGPGDRHRERAQLHGRGEPDGNEQSRADVPDGESHHQTSAPP